jgi:hypothetical protein
MVIFFYQVHKYQPIIKGKKQSFHMYAEINYI